MSSNPVSSRKRKQTSSKSLLSSLCQKKIDELDLFKAIKDDRSVDNIEQLLDAGSFDVNVRDGLDMTLLMYAISNKNESTIKMLLRKKADVNAECDAPLTTLTPFLSAIGEGHAGIVELLLKYGANVNTTNTNSPIALIFAACHNEIDIVKLLLKHGADVNTKDKTNDTDIDSNDESALSCAVQNNNIEMVKLLLEHGADVNTKNRHRTVLSLAVQKNNIEMVKLLLERGADVNIDEVKVNVGIYEECYNPLKLALESCTLGMVELLFARGTKLDTETLFKAGSMNYDIAVRKFAVENFAVKKWNKVK